jgi:hypothetical protein
MKLKMSCGLMNRVFGLVSTNHAKVKMAPNVILPWARSNGDNPPFIRYFEATPFDAQNTAAPRHAITPLVVEELVMILPSRKHETSDGLISIDLEE